MALEAASFIFSSSLNLHCFNNKSLSSSSSIKLGVSISSTPTLYNRPHFWKKSCFQLQSAAESITVALEEEVKVKEKVTGEGEGEGEAKLENSPKPDNRRKLFVLNLPWSFSVADIKKLFSECGAVSDVEVLAVISMLLELGIVLCALVLTFL